MPGVRTVVRDLGIAALAAVVYFASARVSYALMIHPTNIVAIWIPSGVMLALLLRSEKRDWVPLLAGGLLGNLTADLFVGSPLQISVAAGLANALETLVAASALVWFHGRPFTVTTLRGAAAVALGAAAGTNALTALAGAAVLTAGTTLSFWNAWLVWWVGDGMGMLIVTPTILSWDRLWRTWSGVRWQSAAEAAVVMATLVALARILLSRAANSGDAITLDPSMVFPLLFWIAFRFGPSGATTATAAVAALAVWYAAAGIGPFVEAEHSKVADAFALCLYLGVASLSSLLPAAILSERKAAMANLVESENLFRDLVENSADLICTHDLDGEILTINRGVEKALGHTRATLLQMNIGDLLAPEVRPQVNAYLTAVQEKGIAEGRMLLQTASGERRIWAYRNTLRTEGVVSPIVRGMAHDVTERTRAEQSLRDASQFSQQVITSAQEGIVVHGLDLRFQVWNPFMERLTGLPASDVLGRHPLEVMPFLETTVFGALERVVAGGPSEWTDFSYLMPGTDRVGRASAVIASLRDAAGHIVGALATVRDVTELMESHARLAQQASMLDKAHDAILVCDFNHRITFWNRGAERLYGWTAAEILGRSGPAVLKSDPAAVDAAMRELLERGEWSGELTQEGKDHERHTVETSWTLLRDDAGQPQALLAICTDVTARKQLEAQSLRAQRMEAIGQLTGGIAHDINNVLAPILMSIGVLRMDEPDPERRAMLATVESSAKRGADMVRQIVSFARGVEGQRAAVRLAPLLAEVESIVTDTFAKDIQIRIVVQPGVWTVSGDSTQLHQVLLNLCLNARDAMPAGGTLTISAKNVWIDDRSARLEADAVPGPHVVLEVTDTGVGMPPETLAKVFEPFFTTKVLGRGTGIGLSTSLAIIKGHKGFVRARSEPGEGSAFAVFIPAGDESTVHRERDVDDGLPPGHGELVLVVDDEVPVRESAARTLQAFGYRVITASHGEEAVAIYSKQQEEVAAVLTDMMMPVMDGPAMIRVLRQINPSVRIIATSGLMSDARHAGVDEHDVVDFLAKPYTVPTLLQSLRRVLDR